MPPLSESGAIAGVILAAGASRRMGTNKMLLPVHGEPMIRRTVRAALDAGVAPLVVVLGHEPERVRAALDGLDCHFAMSDDHTGPTSASLHAGLRALESAALEAKQPIAGTLVLLGDMVRVTSAMIAALVASATTGTAPLEVSRYGEVLAPPLFFRRALWPELLAWTGEGCGKTVVRAHQAEATMHDWPAEALRDVDTKADYEELTP